MIQRFILKRKHKYTCYQSAQYVSNEKYNDKFDPLLDRNEISKEIS